MTHIRVSDHALVRFLERGAGVPIETLRANLQASLDRARRVAASLDTQDFNVLIGGLRFVVVNNVVVTVTGEGRL
jgi:hypothetical protein